MCTDFSRLDTIPVFFPLFQTHNIWAFVTRAGNKGSYIMGLKEWEKDGNCI